VTESGHFRFYTSNGTYTVYTTVNRVNNEHFYDYIGLVAENLRKKSDITPRPLPLPISPFLLLIL